MARTSQTKTKKKTIRKASSSKPKTKSKSSPVKSKSKTPAAARKKTKATRSSGIETQAAFSEYRILTEDSVRGLEVQVNLQLKNGWSLVGGPILNGGLISQAIIR